MTVLKKRLTADPRTYDGCGIPTVTTCDLGTWQAMGKPAGTRKSQPYDAGSPRFTTTGKGIFIARQGILFSEPYNVFATVVKEVSCNS